ncbi:MAG: helix-turn-helix transcriptional regulator [Hyphomicrobium sp.]
MASDAESEAQQFFRGNALGLSETLAARRAGVSATMFKNLRRAGHGPRYALVGRRIIYRPADVDDWLQQKTRS